MNNSQESKDTYDDLTSLFLPDILHQNPTSIKTEEIDQDFNSMMTRSNPQLPNTTIQSNFNNFLNNNDFIASKPQTFSPDVPIKSDADAAMSALAAHPSHFANYIPYEATVNSMSHSHGHNHLMSSQSQFFPNSNTQPPGFGKPIEHWFNNGGANPFTHQVASINSGMSTPSIGMNNHMESFVDSYNKFPYEKAVGYQDPRQYMTPSELQNYNEMVEENASGQLAKAAEPSDKKEKPKVKAKKVKPNSGIIVDYKPSKLIKLLDLKCTKLAQDYKILGKDGNEIAIDFNGFLNGRFLTNDFDNNNFIKSLERDRDERVPLGNNIKKTIVTDPKVISCYRRNHIQISINLNLSGFNNNDTSSKILKLQTNEYGYTITRVIKWFKIEILANSSISKNQSVALIIGEDVKDKDKPKDDVTDDDFVNPTPIYSNEVIATLSNSQIENTEMDHFYLIKKLQFKNATPNNGNSNFQNYYHLRVKLSAVVADLYYEDYIDDDFSVTNADTTRNEINLFELESEPIIVRGRNPSFYAERKDVMVRGRSVTSKESYRASNKTIQTVEKKKDLDGESKKDDSDSLMEVEKSDDDDAVSTSSESSSKRRKSPSPSQLLNYSNKSLPPVIYNSSKKVDIDNLMKTGNAGEGDDVNKNKDPTSYWDEEESYKYFPVSNVYYLPPINAVYFPHGAHQHQTRVAGSDAKASSASTSDLNMTNPRRKSSKVYFK